MEASEMKSFSGIEVIKSTHISFSGRACRLASSQQCHWGPACDVLAEPSAAATETPAKSSFKLSNI